ncbi:MAG: multicopper oxidase domain-containing protein, partial [Rhodospirillales bacterium]|nr:multicopper oxidase domain-containing protein [Rhodospirillales bacterium]
MINSPLPRRTALKLGGGLVLAAALPRWPALAAPAVREFRLTPHANSDAPLVGAPYAPTNVWSYDGSVPGPEIRIKQGDRLKVTVENRLAVDTTIHWHGIRTPFRMDGVSHLTQKPISPGGRFVYEFDVPDAGTYWYHPHERGFEQVARGHYGALIVEEPEPVKVDRDITWVLDDWRLKRNAQIDGNFDNRMDMSHGGRLGNTITVNGRVMESFPVRAGERIRLRLINVANARHFALEFTGHSPKIIALDGQPVTPHEPEDGRIVLGPAMRADVIIDMSGAPEQKFSVTDRFYQRQEYRLLDLVYDKAAPLRAHPLDGPIKLARNTMPEPDTKSARRHEITFGGGM